MDSRYSLVISHALIGIGLAYVHIFHVENVFESLGNFSHLSTLEREMFFSTDQGLYISYYKTIFEARTFESGLASILNDNIAEYPSTINAMQKFHIYPEVIAGFLYRQFREMVVHFNISTMVYCHTTSPEDKFANLGGIGDPYYFYLALVWSLSGITVFILYMYGTFLSGNILGGITAVIYYFIVHQDATNVHKTPVARENFAFPFILLQMFYLSQYIEKYKVRNNQYDLGNVYRRDYIMIINLAILTGISLLFWQFSTFIFVTQVVALFILLQFDKISSALVLDYTVSQILAIVLAYYAMFRNRYFLTSMHHSMIIGLLIYVIKTRVYRHYDENNVQNNQNFSKPKQLIHHLFIFISISFCIADLSDRFVMTKKSDDITSHYIDLLLTKLYIKPPNNFLISHLYFANTSFAFMDLETLKMYSNVFILKNVSIIIVIFLGKFLHKRRRSYVDVNRIEDIERAKNYVIEDYLEENHITMKNLTDPSTEKAIKQNLELLEKCNFNYDQYKKEKEGTVVDLNAEKLSFLNDIKKLKTQISEKQAITPDDNKESKPEPSNEKPKTSTKTKANNKKEKVKTPVVESAPAAAAAEEPPKSTLSPAIQSYYLYNIIQTVLFIIMAGLIYKLKFVLTPFVCLMSSTIPSRTWFSRNTNFYWILSVFLLFYSIVHPGIKNIRNQYIATNYNNPDLEKLLKWIEESTDQNAVFGGPMDLTTTVLLTTRRPIVNHQHIEFSDMRERTKLVYSVFSKQTSTEIYNQLVRVNVQYLIIPYDTCFQPSHMGYKISDVWDYMDANTSNNNNIPFCIELYQKTNPSFLKVYQNYKYLVIKIFSHSVQLVLKKVNFLEYNM